MIIIPKQRAGLTVEQIDGDLILLDVSSSTVVHVNPTAALVFQLCDGQRTVEDIVAVLSAAYPESEADIPRDVAAAVESLLNQHFLEAAAS